MKREYKRKYSKELHKVFPILSWQRCEKCGQEFRLEKGWKFGVGISRFLIWKYVCGKCIPSKDEAHEYAINWQQVKKPKGPPPPPHNHTGFWKTH